MAAIRKKKTKGGYVWVVDFCYRGKRYRKSTKTSDRKLAELFLKDIEVRIAKDEFSFGDPKSNDIRLNDFRDRYLEHSKATNAHNTYLLDKYATDSFIAFAGNILLRDVSVRLLESYKVKRSETLKPASVNLEIRHLKAAFSIAKKWSYIRENPFLEVKQLRIKGKNIPKFIPKDEVATLLAVIPDGDFKSLIRFYLHTGCRRNEALGLTWPQVDFSGGRILLRETKSGEDRVVPMSSKLRTILSEMSRNGGKPFDFKPDFVTKKFKKYLKASGIKDWKEFTVHTLRHTFAKPSRDGRNRSLYGLKASWTQFHRCYPDVCPPCAGLP